MSTQKYFIDYDDKDGFSYHDFVDNFKEMQEAVKWLRDAGYKNIITGGYAE
ncbi:MAG: hypothetical protein Q8876_07325 [Bacillota bacterium]|nr:hypothetical protein [Bacillota bacterium]